MIFGCVETFYNPPHRALLSWILAPAELIRAMSLRSLAVEIKSSVCSQLPNESRSG